MKEDSKINNLIFRHPIVQTLLNEVGSKQEAFNIEIGIPIRKSFEDKGRFIIAGYASVEVIDSQDELIPIPVLKEAWEKFSSNEDFMIGTLMHSNIPIAKIILQYEDSKGQVWKSGVDDTGLFIVAEINEAIEKGKQTRELIEKGKLTGFSIGGEALASSVHCESKCFTRIDKMELHEIAVVDKPANKPSVFTIVKRLKKQEPRTEEERAISHFNISVEDWNKLLEEEKQSYIDKLPKRGEGKKFMKEKKKIKFSSLILDSSKLDKAIDLLSKRVERRGNKWCVIHCTGPDIGKPIKCFPTKEEANRMHRAIQVNKQDDRPPKAGWDKCTDKARGIESIKDPEAFCGNLWYNDRSKWNTFIKGEDCGCPVDKTILTKSIKKLDKSLRLLVNNQKKKPEKVKK